MGRTSKLSKGKTFASEKEIPLDIRLRDVEHVWKISTGNLPYGNSPKRINLLR
jgi:hypothetical protein